MNSDGSGLTRLTDNSVYDGYPNFSPDGNSIVFSAWDENEYPEIFTMNVDGTTRTQITKEEGAYWQNAPKYNPAGDKIYFHASYNANERIVMMDPDGNNWVNITEPNEFGYQELHLFFNADGSKIVYETTENKGYNNGGDLVIANADGSNPTVITSSADQEWAFQACFHPSEDKLFISLVPDGGNQGIYSIDIDGSNLLQLSDCNLTGVEEQLTLDSELKLFPNPANNQVEINWEGLKGHNCTIRIYTTNGQEVYNRVIKTDCDTYNLNTLDLAKGMYFLELDNSQQRQTQKLIINR